MRFDREPLFYGDGILARGLVELRDDLAALEEPGFWVVIATFEGSYTLARFADISRAEILPSATNTPWSISGSEWQSSLNRDAYLAAVSTIRHHISQGTVYQANLCRILSTSEGADQDLLTLANYIFTQNPAPYSRFIRLPNIEILSSSPERFLSREGNSILSSPIKGTARIASELLAKDNAENVMIVDLMRNDLGSICKTGSIAVPRLLGLEQHPGLVHLVSDVTGELRDGISWSEIFAATMPPGSVSGAPKSSALTIITALESVQRGPYCGAIGWIHGDRAELSVGIRTFWRECAANILKFGTGAGITWGSDPQGEWAETELKAARLIRLASGLKVSSLS